MIFWPKYNIEVMKKIPCVSVKTDDFSAQVEMVPQNYVKLTDPADLKNMEKLIDSLEDNDDVQNVYHNWDQD